MRISSELTALAELIYNTEEWGSMEWTSIV